MFGSKSKILRAGTRGSRLARIQTDWVVGELQKQYSDLHIEIQVFKTSGDTIIDRRLDQVGGKGLFTAELEAGILRGEIDFAVHSLKDLPTELPDRLVLGAICRRAAARDVLVGLTIEELLAPHRSIRIGTSSLRRFAQLRKLYPKIEIENLRGNVDTRIRKVKEGNVAGAVLASAGLQRLGLTGEIRHYFDPLEFIPAPGQGALAVEVAKENQAVTELLRSVHHTETAQCVTAERAVLQRLEGGCQIPMGAYATIDNQVLMMKATIVSPDGRRCVEGEIHGLPEEAERLGRELTEELIGKGGREIIDSIKSEPI